MKTNLPQLLLTAGLSVGIISIPSIAEAGWNMNSSSLTGQISRPTNQDQPQRFTKGIGTNGSSLTGEKTKNQQQSKALSMNGSSLTGEKTKNQQQSKALTMNGSSLTGQSSQK